MTAIDSGIDNLTPVAGLSVELADGVLSVTINRPESLNSLTTRVLAGIADAMERATTDSRVKVVRLGGAGRGFSSGAGMSADDVFDNGGPGTDIVVEANRAIRAITADLHPVVAVVQGPAAGVGVSLALAYDVVLASDKSVFHARLHQGGTDARRRCVGVGRRRDRSHPGDADGVAGRAVAGRRSAGVRSDQRGLPVGRLRGRGRQGGVGADFGPGGGIRQDQGDHQRGYSDRAGFRPRARAARSGGPAAITRFHRGRNVISSSGDRRTSPIRAPKGRTTAAARAPRPGSTRSGSVSAPALRRSSGARTRIPSRE